MSNLRKKININGSGTEIFTTSNRGQVDIYSAIPAGTNTIGKVDLNAGTNSIGKVTLNAGTATIGNVGIADGANLDAFSRLRVSEPVTLFDSQLQYNLMPLLWESSTTGSGTVTHLPNESAARMRCTTASGDKVIRQSKRYIRYQAGKSQLIAITGVMGAKKANVRQRIGLFDANNGLFFEQDSTNLKVVRRTYTSGSPVDNVVNQADWNLDKLDGNGASRYTIDTSKANIFLIDFQWLGVGRVRMGFDIDGKIVYCHEFDNANTYTTVYMTTPNLPVRYEIENLDTTASNTDMIQICSMVMSEGGFSDERGFTHAVSNGITAIGVTTRRPVLSLRLSPTFATITNRAEIIPESFEFYVTTNAMFYEIVWNGTLSTPSWVSAGTNSIGDYDISSTSITGGEVIDSGFVIASASTRNSINETLKAKLVLANDIAGTTPDRISLVCTSFTGTSNIAGSIQFRELY